MTHAAFRIGLEFYTGSGRWRCTDVGTRVIAAIKLDRADPTLYEGPPFGVAEYAFDEYDQEASGLDPAEFERDATSGLPAPAEDEALAIAALKRKIHTVRAVCAEAFQFATVVGAPVRVLDNLLAAAIGHTLPYTSFLPVSIDECHVAKAGNERVILDRRRGVFEGVSGSPRRR